MQCPNNCPPIRAAAGAALLLITCLSAPASPHGHWTVTEQAPAIQVAPERALLNRVAAGSISAIAFEQLDTRGVTGVEALLGEWPVDESGG